MSEKKSKGFKPRTEKERLQFAINGLSIEYKNLVQKRKDVIKDLQKVEEEILKKVGAYQELKKLLDKAIAAEDASINKKTEEGA